MKDEIRGILIVDPNRQTRWASGIAQDSALQEELIRHLCSFVGKSIPTLTTIASMDPPLVVMAHETDEATLMIVQRSDLGDPLLEFVTSVPFAADILRHFVTNPYEAMTVVDQQGLIRYISPVHERFFNMRHGTAIGLPVRDVIENTRLDVVLKTGRAEIGQTQEMRGTTRVVSRTPIFDTEGKSVGVIGQVMFKSPDALSQMSAEIGRLRQEVDFYRRKFSASQHQERGLDEILGTSEAITKLKEQIIKVAALDVPVLLLGESGVGKDLVAHAIHMLSPRAKAPMVVINAAALPASLVESELFGYEGGAFTGAERKGRRGKFEQADQGTLFLDEIGDMPLEVQVKLLRTLQDGSFNRVGGDVANKSDFRLIAASNRDFKSMLTAGQFRIDLFYRISAVTLQLPALRDRLEDIPLLVQTQLERFAVRHKTRPKTVAHGVIAFLQSLPWPGNVRQLQHLVERAAIFSEGQEIQIGDIDPTSDHSYHVHNDSDKLDRYVKEEKQPIGVQSAKSQVELEMIVDAMQKLRGNKKRVAEHLGISRSYLYKKLAEIESSKVVP